jgi:hypothetical protein
MWERIKRYRTVLFHAAYGLPAAAAFAFDEFKSVDISPLLERAGVRLADIPLVLCLIAVGGVVLHVYADSRPGNLRDTP